MRNFTSNGTAQCQDGSLNFLTAAYRGQPRSTRDVVGYPRPAFSAAKRTNHAPISFDSTSLSLSRPSIMQKSGKLQDCTEVHGGRSLELVKPALEPASSHPKPSASLKNAPRILSVPRFLLTPIGREQTGQISAFTSGACRFAPLRVDEK